MAFGSCYLTGKITHYYAPRISHISSSAINLGSSKTCVDGMFALKFVSLVLDSQVNSC